MILSDIGLIGNVGRTAGGVTVISSDENMRAGPGIGDCGDRRDKGHYFDEIVGLIERLRAPGGCPWDRKQTLEDLRTCITEEAYELAEAITERDMGKVREESGDLLLQVVFVASLAREHGDFDMRDVVRTICDKLIRRHPHVFGDVEAEDSDTVLRNWESIKLEERRARKEDLSVLAGVQRDRKSVV